MSTRTFAGKPACECLIKWLPAYQTELLRRGVIKHSLDVYQLIGSYAKSADTHKPGGAYDVGQVSDEAILVAREMGAAGFHRPEGWDNGDGIEHQHGVLRGCPHNAGGRYQIVALEQGFNGLGHLGKGGRDTDPRPAKWRTWKEGIAWAHEQAVLALPTVNLANVRRQFRRALRLETGAVHTAPGVRQIQAALNHEFPKHTKLLLDGKVGAATLERWGQWEQRDGVVDRPRVPDARTLEELAIKTGRFRVVGK